MKYVINSKKDKNSLAARRNFGGIYINGTFYKDGTVFSSEQLKRIGCSDTVKERYITIRQTQKSKKTSLRR